MSGPELTAAALLRTATDRRGFLKQGGALVVGLSLAGCATAPRHAPEPGGKGATAGGLRTATAGPPNPAQLDTWLAIHEDGTATLYMGFAELGQGATTALLQVAAEELDLGMDQIRAAPLDTHLSPNQGGTYSSAAVARGRPQFPGCPSCGQPAEMLVRARGAVACVRCAPA